MYFVETDRHDLDMQVRNSMHFVAESEQYFSPKFRFPRDPHILFLCPTLYLY